MDIDNLYAAICTADMAEAEAFYAVLFGRPPDDRPMDGLVQWREVGGSGVQLVLDADKAGHGLLTIVTPDMSATRSDLATGGLDLGEDVRGDFGIVAQIDDPDHNRITLAEPPQGIIP